MSGIMNQSTAEIIKAFGATETDTGAAGVQIALLTRDIVGLTAHLKAHKKDKHTHRGLMNKVSRRRSLLNYLKNSNFDKYKDVVTRLGLRY